jgi:hypothetical protein
VAASKQQELCRLAAQLGIYPYVLATLLGMSTPTAEQLYEHGDAAIPSHIAERVPGCLTLLRALARSHNGEASSWLLTPLPELEGKRPLDRLAEGNFATFSEIRAAQRRR